MNRLIGITTIVVCLMSCQTSTQLSTDQKLEGEWQSIFEKNTIRVFKNKRYIETFDNAYVNDYSYLVANKCQQDGGKEDVFGDFLWINIADEMHCYKIIKLTDDSLHLFYTKSGNIEEYVRVKNEP